MSEAFTKENCESCGEVFDLPMVPGRGGYRAGSARFSLSYDQEEVFDIDLDSCCTRCASSISMVAKAELRRINAIHGTVGAQGVVETTPPKLYEI